MMEQRYWAIRIRRSCPVKGSSLRASRTGKSTLVRAIAGLWPWGGGTIEIRKGAKLFLLPQRPYVPVGSLRRAVAYPDAPEAFRRRMSSQL